MRTNCLLRSPLPILSALMLAGYAQAQSPYLGVNWEGRNPNTPIGPYGYAGIPTAKQSYWNDVREEGYVNFSGTTPALNDKAGNATAVTLTFAANDSWNNDGAAGTADEKLMHGIIKAFGNPGGPLVPFTDTFTFNNVPAGAYSLVLYLNVNGDGVNVDLTQGATTFYITEEHTFDGTYTQALNADPMGVRDVGNYVVFTGVSPDVTGQITFTMTYDANAGDGSGMAAIQLLQAADTVGPALASATFSGTAAAGTVHVIFDEGLDPAAPNPTFSLDRGVTVGTVTKVDAMTFDLAVTGVTVGNFLVTAHNAKDAAGNTTASSSTVLTVINSNPSAISVQFAGSQFGGNGPTHLLPSDVAGVVPLPNWVSLDGNDGSAGPLTDSDGYPTPVTIQFHADGGWGSGTFFDAGTTDSAQPNAPGLRGNPNDMMFSGYLDGDSATVPTPSTITFNNVPDGVYDVYVYTIGGDTGDAEAFTLNDDPTTTFHVAAQGGPGWVPSGRKFVQGTSMDPANRGPNCNYVLFAGVTPAFDVNGVEFIKVLAEAETFRTPVNAIQLVCHDATPITFVTQPADQTVNEGCPFKFGEQVIGCGARTYQWYCNGSLLQGQTGPTYSGIASAGQNGNVYYVVVTNPAGSATSARATLHVLPNPTVASCGSRGNCHAVYITYKKPVLLNGTYTVDGGEAVTGLKYGENSNVVCVSLSPDLVPDTAYNVTIKDVSGADGTLIGPNPSTCSFVHGSEYPSFRILSRMWANMNGLGDLNTDPRVPCSPDQVFYDLQQMGDTEIGSQIGQIMTGVFIAPQDGIYYFWTASDDASDTYIATDAIPAHKVLMAQEPNWAGRRNFTTGNGGRPIVNENGSVVLFPDGFALTTGQKVYIEADHFQGGGGGNYSLTYVVDPVDPTVPPADGTAETPASQFMQMRFAPNCPGSGEPCGGTIFTKLCDVEVTIAQEPSSLCEGQEVTFTAQVDGTPCYSYQWLKNGQVIAGASGSSYTTSSEANGDVYTVRVSNAFSSADASITVVVLPNPCVVSCFARCELVTPAGGSVVHVVWTKPVKLSPGTYTPSGFVISGAPRYGSSTREVLLDTTTPLAVNAAYGLTIMDVQDLAGDVQVPNPTICNFFAGFGGFAADFNDLTVAPGTAVFGVATVADDGSGVNGVLHLTDGLQTSAFGAWSTLDNGSGAFLKVHFNSRLGNGTGATQFGLPGADGYSFNWAADLPNPPTYANPGEDGGGTGLSVTVDPFDNGGGEAPAVEVRWKAKVIARVDAPQPYAPSEDAFKTYMLDNTFNDFDISVNPEGWGTVLWKDVRLDFNIPGFAPIVGGTFMFGARTGGAAEDCWIDDLSINTFAIPAPVITQDLADTMVTASDPISFTVMVDGVPPTYRWYDNGVLIPGAKCPIYSRCSLLSDNGHKIFVVASNECGMVTSKVAMVTVKPNGLVACAIRSYIKTKVTFISNVALDPATANLPANYSINGGAVAVTGAVLMPDCKTVMLTTDPLADGNLYLLTASGLKDVSGAPIPGTTVLISLLGPRSPQASGGGNFIVVMEAENFDDNNSPQTGANGSGSWIVEHGNIPDASGGANVFCYPDAGENFGSTWPFAPTLHMDYYIDFPVAGDWFIWLRGSTPRNDGSANSCHAGVDGISHSDVGLPDSMDCGPARRIGNDVNLWGCDPATGLPAPLLWGWISEAQRADCSANAMGPARITLDTAGVHAFNIFTRETGLRLDQIVLTTDSAFTLGNCDPPMAAETPRKSVGPELTIGRGNNGLVIQWWLAGRRLQCTTALKSDPTQTVWQDVNDPTTGLPVTSPYNTPANGARFYRLIAP